ncbi:hypothetical protein OSI80_24980, partial [Mycobacterium ulcerans]
AQLIGTGGNGGAGGTAAPWRDRRDRWCRRQRWSAVRNRRGNRVTTTDRCPTAARGAYAGA